MIRSNNPFDTHDALLQNAMTRRQQSWYEQTQLEMAVARAQAKHTMRESEPVWKDERFLIC